MGRDLVVYDLPDLDVEVEAGFLAEGDLARLEDGIRYLQGARDAVGLVQGIALAKIEREELWRQAGFETLASYRAAEVERLGISKQQLSRRRLEGEGFLDNRKLLGRTRLSGNVTKLAYLSEALRVYEDSRLVLEHFRADSFEAFVEWVRPRALPRPPLPDVDVRVDGDEIALDGTPLLGFDEDLPAEERTFIAAGLRDLYRARRGSCIPHVVPCYDAAEARWLDRALAAHRAEK